MRRTGLLAALLLLVTVAPAQASGPPVPTSVLQLITVLAKTSAATTADLNAYTRASASQPWRKVMGPVTVRVGRHGIAAAGAKREGDGKTPSGTYGLSFAFGIRANPGAHLPWRAVTGRYIVWDDDSASARYNEWVDTRTASAGRNPEPLDISPVYDEALVIAYNTARQPGLGSGIFVHVSTGQATSGCVSLPASGVVALVRWLQPGLHPAIQIRVA